MRDDSSQAKRCALCDRSVPSSHGKYTLGATYWMGWIWWRFYCHECLAKGRGYLLVAVALAVLAGIAMFIYIKFFA
jgi:hypothetical protein